MPIDGEELREALDYLYHWNIEQIHREINEVIEKYKKSGNMDPQAWILVWRSRVLKTLERHELDVVDEVGDQSTVSWREIVTEDRGNFESHFFEFEVAALLLSFGHQVSFVEESGDRPGPDLLVDRNMWVECKRKGVEPETETWVREKQNILDDVIEEGMELDDTLHSFVISFQDSKGPEEISDLASTLREMIDNDLDVVEHQGHKIERTGESLQFSDDGTKLNIGREYHTPGSVDTRIVNYVNDDGEVEGFTGAEVRFKFDEDWFYPEKIRQPLRKARSQNLSEKDKGIIFISVPQLYLPEILDRPTPKEDLAPDSKPKTQVERLNGVVTKRFLNTTESVNAVCVIIPTFTNNVSYSPLIQYWKNLECRCPDPNFIDSLERMSKSYYGYLLANS